MRQENYLYNILSINCFPNGESAEEYHATKAGTTKDKASVDKACMTGDQSLVNKVDMAGGNQASIHKECTAGNNKLNAVAEVEFLPESPVYKGHFPGMPITPGVLLLTVAREIVEKVLRISVLPKIEKTDSAVDADQKIVNEEYDNAEDECIVMECAKNVKFLQVLTPDCGPVRFVISELSLERESGHAIDPFNGSGAEVVTVGTDKCLVRAKISIVGSNNDTLYAKMDITYRLTER